MDSAVGFLGDGSAAVRRAALKILSGAGPEHAATVVDVIMSRLKDSECRCRHAATVLLGQIGVHWRRNHKDDTTFCSRYADAVALRLKDRDPAVRIAALTSLGQLGCHGAAIASTLSVAIDTTTRIAAVRALGQLGPESASEFAELVAGRLLDSNAEASFSDRISLKSSNRIIDCLAFYYHTQCSYPQWYILVDR